MVLRACGRLLMRRLALRKGLTLSAAALLLVGTLTVYYQLQVRRHRSELGTTARAVQIPKASLVSNSTHPHLPLQQQQQQQSQHRSNSNVSLSAASLRGQTAGHRGRDRSEEEEEGDGGGAAGVRVVPSSSEECVFSATQRRPGSVDVQMSELVEALPFANPNGGVWKQGFDISYSPEDFAGDPLQVFIMPHSHNDPGWIMTFEEYYRKQTRQILSLMTDALAADPRRKFVWAEISYLDLWWQEQPEHKRELFRRLVAEGQMEIVTGGWVMNDEASPHYFAMLDQMLEGHLWLQENIPGVTPRSCWANDPFGYSPTMAYLLQRMGMEAMLIQRVHYSVKKHLAHQRQLEFAWRQMWDLEGSTDMMCHMMPFYSYDIPHTCGPDPMVCCQFDFKRLPGGKVRCPWRQNPVAITNGNVKERAELLADQYRKKAQLYRSNVLLIPLGDDFRYDTKKEVDDQFANYQLLIDHYSSHPEMNMQVQFGTLSDYFTALRSTVGVQERNPLIPFGFPSLAGDFFTYADRDDHYWSGYFTSRPFYKNLDRVLESNLRSAEIFHSLVIARGLPFDHNVPRLLTTARRSLGLFQHHDGITGTAKDPVVKDYANKMTEAITASKGILSSSVKTLLNMGGGLTFDLEETFPSAETIPSHVTIDVSHDPRTILLVNSLSQRRTQLVALRVSSPNVMVVNSDNVTVPAQINPLFSTQGSDVSSEAFELVFIATVGAVGVASYVLYPGNQGTVRAVVQLINQDTNIDHTVFRTESFPTEDFVLSTHSMEAKFSGKTGLLKSITQGSNSLAVQVDFVSYGTVQRGKDKSGAYLFLPGGEASSLVGSWSSPRVVIVAGPLVQSVRTDLGVVVHTVQLFASPGVKSHGVEGHSLSITNVVDIRQESNKELAMRLMTSIENQDGVFYTDSNGFQLTQRRTFSKLPLQANYYPMPSSAVLQDQTNRLSLLSGQPLGVGSLKQGWLEVMLDRRLMQDDERGLGQGVKDNKVTRETFRLLLERRLDTTSPTAVLAYPSLLSHATLDQLLHPVQVLLPPSPPSPPSHTLSGLTQPLPCDVYLVNLRSLPVAKQPSSALFLHRRGFECGFNIAPLQCDLTQGKVQLESLFSGAEVTTATETTLTLFEDISTLSHDSHMTTAIDPMEIQAYRVVWGKT